MDHGNGKFGIGTPNMDQQGAGAGTLSGLQSTYYSGAGNYIGNEGFLHTHKRKDPDSGRELDNVHEPPMKKFVPYDTYRQDWLQPFQRDVPYPDAVLPENQGRNYPVANYGPANVGFGWQPGLPRYWNPAMQCDYTNMYSTQNSVAPSFPNETMQKLDQQFHEKLLPVNHVPAAPEVGALFSHQGFQSSLNHQIGRETVVSTDIKPSTYLNTHTVSETSGLISNHIGITNHSFPTRSTEIVAASQYSIGQNGSFSYPCVSTEVLHTYDKVNMGVQYFDAQMYNFSYPSWGGTQQLGSNVGYQLGSNVGAFSFQRLISGDITGFEDEFEEDSENEMNDKTEKDRKTYHDAEYESDMYSTVCTLSSQPPNGAVGLGTESEFEGESYGRVLFKGNEVNHKHTEEDHEYDMYSSMYSQPCVQASNEDADNLDTESQQSDDMYHGQHGISKCLTLDKDGDSNAATVQPLGFSDGVRSCHQQQFYGSPSLQQERSSPKQTSSDSSRDLYTDGKRSYTMEETQHGSPCLHPITHSRCPDSPNASVDLGERNFSQIKQETAYGSPCLHPVAETSCSSPNDMISAVPSTPDIDSFKDVNVIKDITTPVPGTAKALLLSGLLEGCQVSYQDKGGGVMLTGVVKNGGILCNCRICKGKVTVNVSCFEKHAGSTARHPSENIFLDNGKSLHEILRTGLQAVEGNSGSAPQKSIKYVVDEENTKKSVNAGTNGHHLRRRSDISSSKTAQTPPPPNTRCRSDMNSSKTVQTPPPSQTRSRYDINSSKVAQTAPTSQTRDMNLHKMLFLPGGLPDGTEVAYYMKGQRILIGRKEGHGICCSCCNEVISCSLFEAHAGWGSRRNPYLSIYLSDGQSLHQYAQSLATKHYEENSDNTSKENDDECGECGDGGDLVLCDSCPGAYHKECVGLSRVPDGDWFCPQCEGTVDQGRKRSTRGRPPNSSAMSGKIPDRCQRIVKASKNAIGGCVVCKNGDFLKSGFGAKTVLLCDQCEREYHVGCMKEQGIADLKELPAGEWFCGSDCTRIHNILQGLVIRGAQTVHTSISSAILEKKRQQERGSEFGPQEFSWQLLHGRRGDPENGRILSEAAIILTESFDPIIDTSSGRDMISLMVHSRSIRDQDFRGMYCAVLKCKESVVSTAIIRVFGRNFAEMPLVATSTGSRGQGFFQILMLSIERLLGMLQVQHLILPAAEEAEDIWKNKFGFSKMNDDQLQGFASQVPIVTFKDSSMLLKSISSEPSSHFSSIR